MSDRFSTTAQVLFRGTFVRDDDTEGTNAMDVIRFGTLVQISSVKFPSVVPENSRVGLFYREKGKSCFVTLQNASLPTDYVIVQGQYTKLEIEILGFVKIPDPDPSSEAMADKQIGEEEELKDILPMDFDKPETRQQILFNGSADSLHLDDEPYYEDDIPLKEPERKRKKGPELLQEELDRAHKKELDDYIEEVCAMEAIPTTPVSEQARSTLDQFLGLVRGVNGEFRPEILVPANMFAESVTAFLRYQNRSEAMIPFLQLDLVDEDIDLLTNFVCSSIRAGLENNDNSSIIIGVVKISSAISSCSVKFSKAFVDAGGMELVAKCFEVDEKTQESRLSLDVVHHISRQTLELFQSSQILKSVEIDSGKSTFYKKLASFIASFSSKLPFDCFEHVVTLNFLSSYLKYMRPLCQITERLYSEGKTIQEGEPELNEILNLLFHVEETMDNFPSDLLESLYSIDFNHRLQFSYLLAGNFFKVCEELLKIVVFRSSRTYFRFFRGISSIVHRLMNNRTGIYYVLCYPSSIIGVIRALQAQNEDYYKHISSLGNILDPRTLIYGCESPLTLAKSIALRVRTSRILFMGDFVSVEEREKILIDMERIAQQSEFYNDEVCQIVRTAAPKDILMLSIKSSVQNNDTTSATELISLALRTYLYHCVQSSDVFASIGRYLRQMFNELLSTDYEYPPLMLNIARSFVRLTRIYDLWSNAQFDVSTTKEVIRCICLPLIPQNLADILPAMGIAISASRSRKFPFRRMFFCSEVLEALIRHLSNVYKFMVAPVTFKREASTEEKKSSAAMDICNLVGLTPLINRFIVGVFAFIDWKFAPAGVFYNSPALACAIVDAYYSSACSPSFNSVSSVRLRSGAVRILREWRLKEDKFGLYSTVLEKIRNSGTTCLNMVSSSIILLALLLGSFFYRACQEKFEEVTVELVKFWLPSASENFYSSICRLIVECMNQEGCEGLLMKLLNVVLESIRNVTETGNPIVEKCDYDKTVIRLLGYLLLFLSGNDKCASPETVSCVCAFISKRRARIMANPSLLSIVLAVCREIFRSNPSISVSLAQNLCGLIVAVRTRTGGLGCVCSLLLSFVYFIKSTDSNSAQVRDSIIKFLSGLPKDIIDKVVLDAESKYSNDNEAFKQTVMTVRIFETAFSECPEGSSVPKISQDLKTKLLTAHPFLEPIFGVQSPSIPEFNRIEKIENIVLLLKKFGIFETVSASCVPELTKPPKESFQEFFNAFRTLHSFPSVGDSVLHSLRSFDVKTFKV